MSAVEDGVGLVWRRDSCGRGKPGRRELHALAWLSGLLLPLPQPDALPLTHRVATVQEHHAGGPHTDQVRQEILGH